MHFANDYILNNNQPESDYMVYILLTDMPNRISKTIKRFGFWHYSHVSLSTSMIDSDFYSYVGKKGFFKEQPLNHPTFRGKPINCALYAVPVTKEECELVTKRIEHHIEVSHSFTYSYIGLIFSYLDIQLKMKKQYTCAGFVSEMLHKSGVMKERKYRRLYSPERFHKKLRNRLVFRGTLKEMLEKFNPKKETA
ncbi:MAG: hypothetical protein J5562_08460 [Clostridia bacterium]|nr:hypothetical protein [Clostridia bacterium]